MAKHPLVRLENPVGGLNQAFSYQRQAPYTSQLLENVRPFDVIEGRGRMGSRPGLIKAFNDELGTLTLFGTTIRGTTGAAVAAGFDDASVADWTTVGITTGYHTLRIYSGTDGLGAAVPVGYYAITVVAVGALTISPSVGGSGTSNDCVYSIGYRPIRMASYVRLANFLESTVLEDTFSGAAPASHWSSFTTSALPGDTSSRASPGASDGSFLVSGGYARVDTNDRTLVMKLDQQTAIEGDATYYVNAQVFLNPSTGYEIIVGMDNTTPVEGNSLSVAIIGKRGSDAQCWLEIWQNRTTMLQQQLVNFDPDDEFAWLYVTVRPGVNIEASLKYETVLHSLSGITLAGQRAALLLHEDNEVSADARVNVFTFYGETASADVIPVESAVFSADHNLYQERKDGTLNKLTGQTMDLASDIRIHAQPRLQKLIIADYGLRHQRLAISAAASISSTGSGTCELDDTGVASWNALSIDPQGDVLEILAVTGVGGGALVPATYAITSVDNLTGVTFSVPPSGTHSATAVAYRIMRGPKVYDPSAGTLTRFPIGAVSATVVSTVPAGCRSVSLWQDKLVWCNNEVAPHGWWMSASGYPYLYDYGDTGLVGENGLTTDSPLLSLGSAAAVNGTQSEFAGLLGEPVVTSIPITDDMLVFACRTSFYYLRGNPRDGGKLNNISRDIGIVDIAAWCRSSEGRLFALTPDGLYEITLERAIPMSRDVIPRELLGLTSDSYEVSLGYEVDSRRIRISASGKTGSVESVHYCYEMRTGAFLPDTVAVDHDPTAMVSYQPGGVGQPVLLHGCRDGFVRKFADAQQSDDGTNFNSRCRYGPLQLGEGAYGFGTLHEIVCVMDAVSGDVTLEVRTGKTAQEAALSQAKYTTTMTAGRNYTRYPRLTNGVAYVDIVGTPGSRWAIETLEVTREARGRIR